MNKSIPINQWIYWRKSNLHSLVNRFDAKMAVRIMKVIPSNTVEWFKFKFFTDGSISCEHHNDKLAMVPVWKNRISEINKEISTLVIVHMKANNESSIKEDFWQKKEVEDEISDLKTEKNELEQLISSIAFFQKS